MSIYKIVFTGPVGTGKTTAIRAISDVEPFATEEIATDETRDLKEHTTVAMDYGMMHLDSGETLHLYGTPGQERFDFMWDILTDNAIGLILLLNNESPEPLKDAEFYLDAFEALISKTGIAVGVTRTTPGRGPTLDDYYALLSDRQVIGPVMETDARNTSDVILLTQSLLYSLDPAVHQ